MATDEPGPGGWRASVVRAASALLGEAAAANRWLVGPADEAPTLVAIGIATVDWERAAASLGGEWRPLTRDPLLGAAVHVLAADRGSAGGDEPLVVLIEPDAEGPLAASLARFGEGLAAVYAQPAVPPEPAGHLGRAARSGPLGPALLVPGPAWGPHVVVLGSAATIGR
jgi:hypothetical protein